MIQKFVVLFTLFLFSQQLAFAQQLQQPSSALIQPLAAKSLLLDIVNVEDKFLVAVGERGHILYSDDAVNWQQANVPVQTMLTKVFFIDDKQGWAVGHDATILHTLDGGLNWQLQQYRPKIEKPLLDVFFQDALQGIAVGAYGLFYRTSDGGVTWQSEFQEELLDEEDRDYLNELQAEDTAAYQEEKASILPHFNRLITDGRTLFLVGEIGFMAKSNDFGHQWQLLDEIYSGSFYDLTRTPDGALLVSGLRGNIYRSNDQGVSWKQIAVDTKALLNNILTHKDSVFVLGNGGTLLRSTDDGQTFSLTSQPDGKSLVAGTFFKGQMVIASEVGIKVLEIR
jgi:photosystem II stability/assembly factor-like uncharacterized protein